MTKADQLSPLDDASANLLNEEELFSQCPELRWGIIGCGRVSHDFCQALSLIPTAKVVACAARSLESAQKFGKTHQIDQCCK